MPEPRANGKRYAIMSDIHSNLDALNSVIADAEAHGVSVFICAGDLVGYCAYPNEVVARLKGLNAICIAGNHDRAVLQDPDEWNMNPQAEEAIRWMVRNVTDDTKMFLRNLAPNLNLSLFGLFPEVEKAGLYHGSPFDDDEYIQEFQAQDIVLVAAKAQVVITGHTHDPFIKYLPHGVWLNPGSVGQPRDGDWRASYVIFDEKLDTFYKRRVEYPVREAVMAIKTANLPYALGARLLFGR